MAMTATAVNAAKNKLNEASAWADHQTATADAYGQKLSEDYDRLGIIREARLMGGAMITLLLIVVVLNEVWNSVNVGTGPFSNVSDDLQNTGGAALGLLVVGLIIVGANALLGRFGGGF